MIEYVIWPAGVVLTYFMSPTLAGIPRVGDSISFAQDKDLREYVVKKVSRLIENLATGEQKVTVYIE